MQFIIRERLRGTPPQGGLKSKGALLLELARELRDLRDELEDKRYGNQTMIKYNYIFIQILQSPQIARVRSRRKAIHQLPPAPPMHTNPNSDRR